MVKNLEKVLNGQQQSHLIYRSKTIPYVDSVSVVHYQDYFT